MRLVRGRGSTPTRDREHSHDLIDRAADEETSVLRVWQPPAHLAFGRRDGSREGYDRARERAEAHDLPVIDRSTGGHAVVFTGNTVSVVLVTPIEDARSGIPERYERVTGQLRGALATLGVDAHEGEPDGAFCPGTHSLSAGGKIVGLAQRVRRDVAVVAGIVTLRDHDEITEILGPVYDALDIPFDSDATGSIARAGGETDSEVVCRTIESALAPDDAVVEQI
ncbi:lipoate--protein ligase family protein [Halovenus halobia]|uniref:lipoate--protein ligase family protein n=1 Tax=Halovenus halobia TaxID=3396622 RepID=UPI003F56568C